MTHSNPTLPANHISSGIRRSPCITRLGGFLIVATLGSLMLSSAAYAAGEVGNRANGNTALGSKALDSLPNQNPGTNNTALGFNAMFDNTIGSGNTGTGSQVLQNNTSGNSNAAHGFLALGNNTIGSGNTADGSQALNFNTVGNENTATGNNALFNNTTGNDNTASGVGSSFHNTVGMFNTSGGASSLFANVSGSFNTAEGGFALSENTGNNNIALGYTAGTNLTTGDFNIDIGNQGVAGESSTIRIGTDGNHQATFIAGINNATVVGTAVLIDASGHLGTILSARRFKEEIKPMDKASEAILAMKPVTFRYKNDLDAKGTPQFGLIAEEVEKINPALVARDANGKAYSVRYESINAMLLNEFLKEHNKVEELKSAMARQDEKLDFLKARLEQQEAQMRKINAQVELNNTSSRLVENRQ